MKQCITFCFLLLSIPFGIVRCKSSTSIADLQMPVTFSQKLPHLNPIFDLVQTGAILNSAIQRSVPLQAPHAFKRTSYFQDANVPELLASFARDVERNMTRQGEPVKGYISCRITPVETPSMGLGMTVGPVLTFYSTLFVGIPIATSKSALEIEVVIRDHAMKPIKRYWGVAHAKKYSGIYYGCCYDHLQRTCNRAAFQSAWTQVKKQIEVDTELLEKHLL